ncbi:DUF4278 domain-containing protein [Oscillatoria sp. FACHB-1407]|uniref:DUF4278 domain-containing protein n=1 Tax=Oscillatoria sp. FACHB-1407 TaxID=2692847 RepID=UPI001687DF6C|nr:DUF4278 domain-containing protein [Oscillatoria sp. FACHB-1407]MBD2461266.1 DUF4278 domain-containing protein [Oscillatoria sp. FACHB-1407]
MQLHYRGQIYSYPYTEQTQVSTFQPLCIYRGVKTSATPVTPTPTVSSVTPLRYRGIPYLPTLVAQFN